MPRMTDTIQVEFDGPLPIYRAERYALMFKDKVKDDYLRSIHAAWAEFWAPSPPPKLLILDSGARLHPITDEPA